MNEKDFFYFDVCCKCHPQDRFGIKERFDNLEDADKFAQALSVMSIYCDVAVFRHDVFNVLTFKSSCDHAGE